MNNCGEEVKCVLIQPCTDDYIDGSISNTRDLSVVNVGPLLNPK